MSENDVVYKEIAAAVLLLPGDQVNNFAHAAANLGNRLLREGCGSEDVIERLVQFGAVYTELRDNMEPPADPAARPALMTAAQRARAALELLRLVLEQSTAAPPPPARSEDEVIELFRRCATATREATERTPAVS